MISLSRLGPMSLEAGGGIPCRLNPAATFLVRSACSVILLAGLPQSNQPISVKFDVMIGPIPIGRKWLTFG